VVTAVRRLREEDRSLWGGQRPCWTKSDIVLIGTTARLSSSKQIASLVPPRICLRWGITNPLTPVAFNLRRQCEGPHLTCNVGRGRLARRLDEAVGLRLSAYITTPIVYELAFMWRRSTLSWRLVREFAMLPEQTIS
jgi:hypothetical protein